MMKPEDEGIQVNDHRMGSFGIGPRVPANMFTELIPQSANAANALMMRMNWTISLQICCLDSFLAMVPVTCTGPKRPMQRQVAFI